MELPALQVLVLKNRGWQSGSHGQQDNAVDLGGAEAKTMCPRCYMLGHLEVYGKICFFASPTQPFSKHIYKRNNQKQKKMEKKFLDRHDLTKYFNKYLGINTRV
jgi:hypothetical protein